MRKEPKLPTGWVFSTIGEVCEPSQYGYTAKASASGRTHYLRTTDITSGFINWASVPYCDIPENEEPKYLLNDGDVVISRAGSVGFSCLILNPAKSVFASYLIRFRPLILPKYFSYFLNTPTYWESIGERSLGIAVQNVNATNLSEIKIPIAPKAEQISIVEKLEELFSDLDAGVAELKAAQKKLAQYRQSLLKAAVEGTLTSEWRTNNKLKENGAQLLERILKERRARWEEKQLTRFKELGKTPPKDWQDKYPEPARPDTTNLPELPEGWVWATIDQLTIEQKYGSSSKTNADSDGVPVIRMGNIQDGDLDLQNMKYLPTEHNEFPGLFLADGDLLFNRTNSPELVGKTAVYRSQIVPCSYASYLIAVRFSSLFVPEFAAAYINSGYGRLWVKSVAVQQVGQANVNGTKLSALAIPLPPLKEQSEIIRTLQEQLDNARQQFADNEVSLLQAAAQRRNILKEAFSGQLVPQDPHDEPASMLLERIRADRVEREKQPKKRQIKAKKEIAAMSRKLFDVLAEAGDWLPAQEAFRRCGVADGAQTDQVEEVYTELRQLDKAHQLAVEAVTDAQGHKQYDRLRLIDKD